VSPEWLPYHVFEALDSVDPDSHHKFVTEKLPVE
jgi:hypothetical protein